MELETQSPAKSDLSMVSLRSTAAMQQVLERRAAPRRPYAVRQLMSIHGDGRRVPAAETFAEVDCHDIAPGGISFYWHEQPRFEQTAFLFPCGEQNLILTARVRHWRQVSRDGRLVYLVGCQFTSRLTAEGDAAGRMPIARTSVVLVDDDPQALRMLEAVLSGTLGHRVALTPFNSSVAARRYLLTHKPDILITDLSMPEVDGLAILSAAEGGNPWLQTFLMTADDSYESLLDALDAGATDFVQKPIEAASLLERIVQALERQRRWKEKLARRLKPAE